MDQTKPQKPKEAKPEILLTTKDDSTENLFSSLTTKDDSTGNLFSSSTPSLPAAVSVMKKTVSQRRLFFVIFVVDPLDMPIWMPS